MKPGFVLQAHNPRTQEVEAERSIQGQFGPHNETLEERGKGQKKKNPSLSKQFQGPVQAYPRLDSLTEQQLVLKIVLPLPQIPTGFNINLFLTPRLGPHLPVGPATC